MPLFITQGRAYRANRSTINLHRWLATVFVNLVLGVASIFSVVSPLVAAPVTYTEEATASGSLGGVAFTNADVVLSMTNDTDNVIRKLPGVGTLNESPTNGPGVAGFDRGLRRGSNREGTGAPGR